MKRLIVFSVMVIMLLGAWVAWPAKYDLKVNLDKGKSYLFEYTNSQVVLVAEQIESDALQNKISFICKISGDSIDGNGDIVLNCSFTELALRSWQGRYLYVDYNSKSYKPGRSQNPSDLMAKLLHDMLNKSFVLKISNRGRIQELSGLNEVITRVASKMSYDPMLEQMLKASLKARISEELLLAGFENTFCILPEAMVALGETWTKENKGRLKQGLNLKNIYTLTTPDETNRNLLHFNVKSEISEDGLSENGLQNRRNFSCSQKGSGTLNSRSGLLNEAELEQTVSSLVSSETNKKVPLNVRSKVSLKLRETEN